MSEAKIVLTAVDQTKAALESAKRNMSSIGDTITRVSGLMGILGGGAVTAASAVTQFSQALRTLDMLDDMAEKTGVSVEALSKLRFAGESVGTTTEQLGGGLRKLAKLMGDAAGGSDEAAEIFKALGVSFNDANGKLRNTDEVLADIADRFSKWEDGPAKAAWSMKVFGKSGEDLIPVLNLGKSGMNDLATEATKLGAVLDKDAAENAAKLNDNLKKISLVSESAAASIMNPLVDALGKLSQAFIDAKVNGEGLFGSISRAVSKLPEIPAWMDGLPMLKFARIFQQSGKVLEGSVAGASKAGAGRGTFADPRSSGRAPSIAAQTRGWDEAPPIPGAKPDKPKESGNLAANFINNLITQYSSLSGSMSKVDEVQRMLSVSGDKFSKSQREQALAIADQIDGYKYKQQVWEAEEKAMRENIALQEQAEQLYGRTILALSDEARAMAFNTSLIGKTGEEIERLRFERELSIRVAQAESQVMADQNMGYINQAEALGRLAAVQRLANETRAQFMAQQADQISQQYDAMRGVSDAVKEYQLSISKMGENTKNVMTNAFRGMEDALVNFVKTGKLDFKSLADSIISDMIRMQIQQSITGPLSGVLGTAISNIFGPGQMGPSQTPQALPSSFDQYLVKSANGNVMTPDGPMPLNRYANGGIATSPQLSIFGEGRMNEAYVPLPDGRTIPVTMSGGGGSNVIVNVMPTSGQTADVQQRQNGDGTTTIDVILRQVQDGLADGVASGSGSLFNAIGSRFTPRGAQ